MTALRPACCIADDEEDENPPEARPKSHPPSQTRLKAVEWEFSWCETEPEWNGMSAMMEPCAAAMLGRIVRTLFAGSFRIAILPFDQATQTSPGAEVRSRGSVQIAVTEHADDDEELTTVAAEDVSVVVALLRRNEVDDDNCVVNVFPDVDDDEEGVKS